MFPILIDFDLFTIHSYGFLMVIGFVVALILIRKKAAKQNLSVSKVTDLIFWTFIMGLLGGRTLFIATTWDHYQKHPFEILKFWQGGLVFYGGLIAGILTLTILARYHKISMLKVLDITAPSMAIAHVIGRIGCFAAGCCFGHEVSKDFPLSVVFHNPQSVAPKGIHLHPAQLYDSVNTLIIFLILQWLYKKRQFDGQIIATYGMLYAIGRWIVEEFRGDSIRGFLFNDSLSTSQFISILIFSISLTLYIVKKPQKFQNQ